ncbi:MAG: S24/S26 family peptidase [Thermoleophilia bacterium]|nr:S24/S26 family peptidase [Thermoleophilia bacterium]
MITAEQLDDLWRDGLRNGRRVGLTVASDSMAPLIYAGDRIIVEPYEHGEQPRLGDIVLFDSDGHWVVHRIIGRSGRGSGAEYRQKGDAGFNAMTSPAMTVAGRVTRIEKRGGARIDLRGRHQLVNGFLGRFFYALDLLRRLGERSDGSAVAGGETSAVRLAAARLLRWLERTAARIGAYLMRK